MAIFRGTGGTGDSTTDTTVNTVTQKAAEAAASATAAASSATQAANSAASINANIVNDTTPQLGGELDGQTNKITNIGDPTSAQDAATKTYVDSQVQSKDALSELSGDSDDITEGSTNLFLTTTERTKLSGIEASATADQTAAEIRTLVESASDSNVFTDADHSKLDGIEASATADQTDAEIKTAYENNSDTNAFTDAEKTKLSGIETGATADQTASEILTAIKTVDGSGSGLDADLLDGNEASAFATSAQGSTADSALQNVSEDTTPQLGGDLDLNSNDITGTGNINITGTLQTSSNAIIGGDLTVSGTTTTVNTETINLADNNIVLNSNHTGTPTQNAGITIERGTSTDKVFQWNESSDYWETDDNFNVTGNITVSGTVDGRDVAADGTTLDAVASTYVNVSGDTLTGDLAFGDNVKAKFGASDDLQIYHDGSNSYITDPNGFGNLILRGSANVQIEGANGENCAIFNENSSVRLFYDNVEKFATTSSGVDITGTVVADGLTVDGNGDVNGTLEVGTSSSGILNLMRPSTNYLRANEAGASIAVGVRENLRFFTGQGENEFLTNERLRIANTGDISFYEDTGTTAKLTWDASDESLNFSDSVRLKLGSSADFQGFHNGSNSYWENYTGDLYIDNRADDKDVNIRTDNGSGGYTFYFKADGSTGDAILYHYGTEKIKTQSGGVDVTGTVTADGFLGGTNVLRINSLEGTRGSIQISAPHLGTREVTYGNNFYLASDGTYKQDSAVIGGGLLQITAPNAEFGEFLFKSKQDPDSGGAVRDRIKIANSGDISFYNDAGSSQDLYWDASTSRLGLGTTSPLSDIHIAQSSPVIRMEDTDNNAIAQILYNTASGGLLLRSDVNQATGTSGSNIIFQTDGSEAMRIDSSGNVGIGTTSPQEELDISSTNPAVRLSDTTTSGLYHRVVSSGNNLYLESDAGNVAASSFIGFRTDGVEHMRLTSDRRLGIGTTSPDTELDVEGTVRATTGSEYTELKYYGVEFNRLASYVRPDNNNTKYLFIGSNATYRNWLRIEHGASESHRFHIGASEAARIDSSGNLLVGKTSASISTAGGEIRSSGIMAATVSNGTPLYLSRLSTDGEIIQLRKDGSTIGSIGVLAGHLGIAEGGCGLRFENDTQRILPANSTYGTNDASIDLGRTDGRFKDLYLSGGVYLGGTGSANLLDDYEEGTFTPTFGGSTADPSGVTYDSQIGTYTKVGTSVQVTIKLGTDAITSVGSGNLRIRGLPFNPNYGLGAGRLTAYSFASNIEDYNILIGNGYFDLLKGSPFGYAQTSVLGTGTNANRLWVTFSYETT